LTYVTSEDVIMTNPFRIGEKVRGAAFTDRATEVRRVTDAMRERGRLLVWGPRRMGKSTLIGVAAERMRRRGGIVLEADLATVTTLGEAADRLLAAVSQQRAWRERLIEWVQSLAPQVTLSADPTGQPRLGVSLEARPRREENERVLLERVLDRIEEVAASRTEPVVVVLDEFQRLSELGGEPAEWLLRNRMQEHRHTAYVCAGSKEALIEQMLRTGRAFYGFFEQLHVGPIDREHLARWIDDRLIGAGVSASDVGPSIIDAAGPRTQDVLLVARSLWFRYSAAGHADAAAVAATMHDLVTGDDAAHRRTWEDLTPPQQRLLRAVAAGEEQLHAAEPREYYRLGPSSSVTTALTALENRAILQRSAGGLVFENPFFREWVRRET
jgi:uncharacterized protein